MIKPHRTGLLAGQGDAGDLAEGIAYMIGNARHRRRMGAEAQKLAQSEYAIGGQVERYRALYRDFNI